MRGFLAIAVLVLGSAHAAAPEDTGPSVGGVVRRAGRGTRAEIAVRPQVFDPELGGFPAASSEPVVARGEADASGVYRVTVPAPGRYEVTATAPNGAVGLDEVVVLTPTHAAPLDVEVPPGDLHLRGRIVDEDGKPYGGRLVVSRCFPPYSCVLRDCFDVSAAETDRDGRFAVHGLDTGAFTVRPALCQRTERLRGWFAVPRTTEAVFVAHGRPSGDPRPAWRLEGTVTTEEGSPLSGVRVRVAGLRRVRDATTDANGRYAFTDVDEATVQVFVNDPRWVSREAQDARGGSYDPFRVAATDDGRAVRDLVAVRAAKLRGSVLDPGGRGIPQAIVSPVRYGRDPYELDAGSSTTGADGSFEIRGMIPGCSYDAVARAAGYEVGHVRTPERSDAEELRIVLKPARRAEAWVFDADTGRGIPDALVVLTRWDCIDDETILMELSDEGRRIGWTDGKGRATFARMSPGHWFLRADAPGWFTARDVRTEPREAPADVVPVPIAMRRGAPIAGHVSVPEDADLTTLEVSAAGRPCGRTDDPLGFRLEGVQEPVVVHAEVEAAGHRFRGTASASPGDLDIRVALEPAADDVREPPWRPVRGLHPEGRVSLDETLFVVHEYDDGSVATDIAYTGEPDPPPAPERRVRTWFLVDPTETSSAPTRAGPFDDLSAPVEVTLAVPRAVEGRVLDDRGRGVRGVRVRARARASVAGVPLWIRERAASTTDEGRFRIDGLGDFDHDLVVEAPSRYAIPSPRAFHPPDTVVVRFGAPQRVTVRLLDFEGRPLERGAATLGSQRIEIPPDGVVTVDRVESDGTYVLAVAGANDRGEWAACVPWTTADSEVRCPPAVAVRGRLVGDDARRARVEQLRVRSPLGPWKASYGPFGADGRFTAGPVPAGPFDAEVELEDGRILPPVRGTTAEPIEIELR